MNLRHEAGRQTTDNEMAGGLAGNEHLVRTQKSSRTIAGRESCHECQMSSVSLRWRGRIMTRMESRFRKKSESQRCMYVLGSRSMDVSGGETPTVLSVSSAIPCPCGPCHPPNVCVYLSAVGLPFIPEASLLTPVGIPGPAPRFLYISRQQRKYCRTLELPYLTYLP